MIYRQAKNILQGVAKGTGGITVLTGAGISAESGIPTFRGPEGYWTIGSSVYHPQEMATNGMFCRQPAAVWKWYLYRIGVCKKAAPNAGHFALVEMEQRFKNRFTLITQNVDNLHLRAGSSRQRTLQIHGNIFFMRCADECSLKTYPIPAGFLEDRATDQKISESDVKLPVCPDCGSIARPHVLWFDEMYNEHHYRYDSALNAARKTELLIVVGTSGATSLPNLVAWEVKHNNGIIIDVNIEENTFSNLASSSRQGLFIKAASSSALPRILNLLQ
jgi:NAD-dependent deacetylase